MGKGAARPPRGLVGLKAQDTSELFFRDMRVPGGNILGGEGQRSSTLRIKLADVVWSGHYGVVAVHA